MNKKTIIGSVGLVLLLTALLSGGADVRLGGFKSATVLQVATTSIASVGTTASTLFATSTCAARVISTVEKPIMLTFSDYAGQTPTGTFGHLQSASTTVNYDAGLYGCGRVRVFGFDASSTITVTEYL